MRTIFLLVASAALLVGQGTQIPFIVPSPPPVNAGSAAWVGEPGQSNYYYWIVAKYTAGNAAPYGPLSVLNVLPARRWSTRNYATVSWTAVPEATGYDVLRTTTSVVPTGACGCAVTLATASTSLVDQSETLQAYTVTTLAASYGKIFIDNRNFNPAQFRIDVDGTVGPLGSGGGAWGTITGTVGDQTDLAAELAGKVPTTRTITCDTGLTGCADLTADWTLGLAPNALTEKVTPVPGADFAVIWDVAGGAVKKAKWPTPFTIDGLTEKATPVTGVDMIPIYDVAGTANKKAAWPSIAITSGTSLPGGACANGTLFQKTDDDSGEQIYECEGGSWVKLKFQLDCVPGTNTTCTVTGTTFAINSTASGANPGGSATEVQYRSGASTLGAVTGSSFDATANTNRGLLLLGMNNTVGGENTLGFLKGGGDAQTLGRIRLGIGGLAQTQQIMYAGDNTPLIHYEFNTNTREGVIRVGATTVGTYFSEIWANGGFRVIPRNEASPSATCDSLSNGLELTTRTAGAKTTKWMCVLLADNTTYQWEKFTTAP